MKCQLKNVKINNALSEETTCFSATLYIDGKKAATVGNRGCGGDTEMRFEDRTLEQAFRAYCKSLPPLPPTENFPRPLAMDTDLFIGELLEKWEINQQKKKWCRNETVFRLVGDAPSSWRTIPLVFNLEVKKMLIAKYANLEEIANETLE